MKLFSTRSLAIVLLASHSIMLSSCGYLSIGRGSYFEPKTEDVTVSYSENEEGPFIPVEGKKKVHLNHYKKKYYVKQEKEGHVEKVSELKRSEPNHLKRVDILTMVMNDVAMTVLAIPRMMSAMPNSSFTSPFPDAGLYTMLGIGLGGWGAIMPSPGALFPRKVVLPELTPILKKDSTQLYLASNDHKFRLGDLGVDVRDWPDRKQYDKGWGYEKRDSALTFESVEETDLYAQVAKILDDMEYGIDTSEAGNTTSLFVDSRVTDITFQVTESKMKCKAKISWALETTDQLQYVYDRTMSGETEWTDLDEESLTEEEQKEVIQGAMNEAIQLSLYRFIGLDTVQSILNAPPPIPLMEEEELALNTGTKFCESISDAVKSVVTIVTPQGHGSGCVITADGYILTNAHVVDEDTTELEAIIGDDVENKVPLEFIRMNDAVDLALLKVDTNIFTPLNFAPKEEIQTGVDVYAVGTPADIELGQTLTRGIVSGKRKFGGHAMIQTDVAINPGNSGGALILKDGRMIGVVTAELKNRQIDDIGFAIPVNVIESALKIQLTE